MDLAELRTPYLMTHGSSLPQDTVSIPITQEFVGIADAVAGAFHQAVGQILFGAPGADVRSDGFPGGLLSPLTISCLHHGRER